jgi:PAS domain-containing protein
MTSKLIRQKNSKLFRQEKRIAELKKSLIYYKEITETMREPFLILDNEFRVVTANPAFYKKFKVLKKDTEGRLMYELGDSQWDASELRDCLERILPKKRKLNDYEITLDFPALGRRTMLLSARQVDAKELILLAVEDVTEQKLDVPFVEYSRYILMSGTEIERTAFAAGIQTKLQLYKGELEFANDKNHH